MVMRSLLILIAAGLLVSCGYDAPDTEANEHPILDLDPIQINLTEGDVAPDLRDALVRVIDGARVVALGESRHDTSEQFLVKATLLQLMITDFGYRTVIIEESFSHALEIDSYVTTGAREIRPILANLAGWYLWDTEEMVNLITWIRKFNLSAEEHDMVRVLGMDITASAQGVRAASIVAHEIDPQRGWISKDYGAILHEGDLWPVTLERYRTPDKARRTLIRKNLEELAGFATEAVRPQRIESEYAGALFAIQAEIGVLGHEMFCSPSIAEGGATREHGMGRVVEWIDSEIAGSKGIVIWTDNLHAAKTGFRMPEVGSDEFTPLGVLLQKKYGECYRAIGGTFGEGYYSPEHPPGEREFHRLDASTVDGAMSLVADYDYFVEIRNLVSSSEATTWLTKEHEWRMQDAMATMSPLAGFDAVYCVGSIWRATPTPNAVAKYSGLN